MNPSNEERIKTVLGDPTARVSWLAGDGSNRSYYRVTYRDNQSYVIMQLQGEDIEKVKGNRYDWIPMAQLLEHQNVCAPQLVRALRNEGLLIIDDYGDITFEQEAKSLLSESPKDLDALYGYGFDIILQFLKIPRSNHVWARRAFDHDRYLWELDFFYKQFINQLCPDLLSKDEMKIFYEESRTLSNELAAHSEYFVHRDFHSRNLMFLANNEKTKLAVIDFQDARLGSPAYDLVSLVFDSYVPLNLDQRLNLLDKAIAKINQDLSPSVAGVIKETWAPMLIQRQLKALGSFAFLTLAQKRGDFLKYIRPALATLDPNALSNKNWPFLSTTLIEKLKSVDYDSSPNHS